MGVRSGRLPRTTTTRRKPRALLDEAGYPDPDGDGPRERMRLTLKIQNLEFRRLQATVIQQNLREVGIDLDVRSYEFATLYADVLKGNFQLYTLAVDGGSLVDPDILRRVFHSTQMPPAGFNRGHFSDPHVDALLDEASRATDVPSGAGCSARRSGRSRERRRTSASGTRSTT